MSPSPTTASATATELVPIADRLRYLQGFRILLTVVVGLVAVLNRDRLNLPVAELGAMTGAYLALSFAAYGAWSWLKRGGLAVFGGLLILDGVYLACASFATGAADSPVRYLIILHLIAVALLASHRTGMKLALWHSLLLLVVHYAEQAELLKPEHGGDTTFGTLASFSAVFWFVAI